MSFSQGFMRLLCLLRTSFVYISNMSFQSLTLENGLEKGRAGGRGDSYMVPVMVLMTHGWTKIRETLGEGGKRRGKDLHSSVCLKEPTRSHVNVCLR
jgi:hypothetical protein